MRIDVFYVMMVLLQVAATIIYVYFLWLWRINCSWGGFFLSLFHWFLFLFIIIIDFLSCMVVEMMHSGTEEALHNLRTSVSSVLTCLETHITCVMLLTLLRFIIRCVFGNFAEACVMSVGFTENAVSWCRWPSIAWGSCKILIVLVVISWFSFETITLIGLVPIITPFLFMWCLFDRCIVGVHIPSCWLASIVWSALLADVLCFFFNVD